MRNLIMFMVAAFVIAAILTAGCTQPQPAQTAVPALQSPMATPSPVPVVNTDAGAVSGTNQGGLRVFHNIPFAAPPTGDLRWRPPAAVQPWSGVRDGTKYSPACPQPVTPDPKTGEPIMNEDCLYLDVWTPAQSADEKLPVMIFFFGGAFGKVAPTGSLDFYNATLLANKGVVVVTPNYRLGALGFLAHPELDAESGHNSSGNYGIMDQVAAMQWVQQNIASFGGDPSRVTIFGQSAGGESVLIHLVSPGSKGLYQQALVESGPFWAHGPTIDNVHSKADAEQFGQEYAKSLGYSGPDAMAKMRTVSVAALINATPWPASSWGNTHTLKFEPTIDGWVLPDSVDNTFLLRKENPVPFVIGTNAGDGQTLSANANMSVADYQTLVRNYFGKDADKVLAQYPASSPAEVQIRLAQIMERYDFADAAKFAAGSMADLNRDTYLYRYSYLLPGPIGQENGVFHGSETFLLFGSGPLLNADPAVSNTLVDGWTRFAKTGNPNGGPGVTWPQYTSAGGQYLDINSTVSVKTGY
jgi:para-nitrobenzyl esterase